MNNKGLGLKLYEATRKRGAFGLIRFGQQPLSGSDLTNIELALSFWSSIVLQLLGVDSTVEDAMQFVREQLSANEYDVKVLGMTLKSEGERLMTALDASGLEYTFDVPDVFSLPEGPDGVKLLLTYYLFLSKLEAGSGNMLRNSVEAGMLQYQNSTLKYEPNVTSNGYFIPGGTIKSSSGELSPGTKRALHFAQRIFREILANGWYTLPEVKSNSIKKLSDLPFSMTRFNYVFHHGRKSYFEGSGSFSDRMEFELNLGGRDNPLAWGSPPRIKFDRSITRSDLREGGILSPESIDHLKNLLRRNLERRVSLATRQPLAILSSRSESLNGANRFATVPHSMGRLRPIASEMVSRIAIQLSYREYLQWCLKVSPGHSHLDTTDQEPSRKLALRSSKTQEAVTTDLSDASNSLSVDLVYWLGESFFISATDWDHLDTWEGIFGRPQSTVLSNGRRINLRMFGGMGNGSTFDIQSLAYYALALGLYIALIREQDDDDGLPKHTYEDIVRDWADKFIVYGDDIITVSTYTDVNGQQQPFAPKLYDHFRAIGFTINSSKSYVNRFKESCGEWATDGFSVKPLRYSRKSDGKLETKTARDLARLIAMHNNARKAGLTVACSLVIAIVKDVWGDEFVTYTLNEKDGSLFHTDRYYEVLSTISLSDDKEALVSRGKGPKCTFASWDGIKTRPGEKSANNGYQRLWIKVNRIVDSPIDDLNTTRANLTGNASDYEESKSLHAWLRDKEFKAPSRRFLTPDNYLLQMSANMTQVYPSSNATYDDLREWLDEKGHRIAPYQERKRPTYSYPYHDQGTVQYNVLKDLVFPQNPSVSVEQIDSLLRSFDECWSQGWWFDKDHHIIGYLNQHPGSTWFYANQSPNLISLSSDTFALDGKVYLDPELFEEPSVDVFIRRENTPERVKAYNSSVQSAWTDAKESGVVTLPMLIQPEDGEELLDFGRRLIALHRQMEKTYRSVARTALRDYALHMQQMFEHQGESTSASFITDFDTIKVEPVIVGLYESGILGESESSAKLIMELEEDSVSELEGYFWVVDLSQKRLLPMTKEEMVKS